MPEQAAATSAYPPTISGVVQTIPDRCKRCYSCVRTCPAKAIKIVGGQAHVMPERCIGCGSCIRACGQNAKRVASGLEKTEELLDSGEPVVAILAPSFPAAFPGIPYPKIVGAIKQIGFRYVVEVALGADLISREYTRLAQSRSMPLIITTPCPAIVSYVEKYRPGLLLFLAPIVSPMIATARVVKWKLWPNAKVVFIGPCIGKKREKDDPKVAGVVDEVLTYREFKELLARRGGAFETAPEAEFDGPSAYIGRIFPVSGGLLKTAALRGDILDNDIIVTEGRERALEILKSVEQGRVEARFLDILFCEGCINGPVMDNDLSVFIRKDIVANYVRSRLATQSREEVERQWESLADVSLRREFTKEDLSLPTPTEEDIRRILASIGKYGPEDELNCGACGYSSCREKAAAVFQGLAEVEMCLPYLIERLERMNQELLQAQERMIRAARLASMGELAAGVAHEINNPLTGVLTYIKVMERRLASEEVPRGDLAKLRQYLDTMEHEIVRCSEIVKNLLEFARPTKPTIEPVAVPELFSKALALVKHQIELQNIRIVEEYPEDLPRIEVDFKQFQQVLLNLIINSAQAMPNGGTLILKAEAVDSGEYVDLIVEDTGCGIRKEDLPRIFDPFFTTKLDKKGTGLGLSMVYSIVQRHGGSIDVQSEVGVGTKFTIRVPVKSRMSNEEAA
ncbi:MAG: ATP-binding protein [candidate division KSB1 bacterium]|nr:ATP-binding protein [candidate division KSB1 bacterium]